MIAASAVSCSLSTHPRITFHFIRAAQPINTLISSVTVLSPRVVRASQNARVSETAVGGLPPLPAPDFEKIFGIWIIPYFIVTQQGSVHLNLYVSWPKTSILLRIYKEWILIKLKHIVHGAVVSEIEMTEGDFTIGRNDGNNLQLDGGGVSGEHAVITLVADTCIPEMFDISIRDLNSTNGTYVNNNAVKEQKIEHGDYIRFGTYEYKVFDDQSYYGTQTEYHISEE